MYASSAEAKANGWFSRRHANSDANKLSRERYQLKARPAARINRRLRRIEKAAKAAAN